MFRQVHKVKQKLFARLYPTTIVFKDGSTITARYHEPRQIIKYPLTLEDCTDEKSRLDWGVRRRELRAGSLEADKEDIKFDARKYLRPRKK